MIKAIALDPGVTTGFAIGEITHTEEDLLDGSPIGLMWVQTAQAKLSHKELMDYLVALRPHHIICESFEYRNQARTGLVLKSKELIGIVELYAQMQAGKCELKMQPPGHVIGKDAYFTDDRLKRSGIYRKGQIHANEAVKHLLYWFQFGAGFRYYEAGFKLKTPQEAK
jgi:hypothetical protein